MNEDELDALAKQNLNLLVDLHVILDEQNTTAAARRLHKAQSAVSHALNQARKMFNDPLLVPVGREMLPTPSADQLRDRLPGILNTIHTLLPGPDWDPATATGRYRIMASDYVTHVLLRHVFQDLTETAPGLQIQIRPYTSEALQQLRRGELVVVIMPKALATLGDTQHLEAETLWQDHFVVAADPSHPDIIEGEPISPETFTSLPYVEYTGGPVPSLADVTLGSKGIVRRVNAQVESFLQIPFALQGSRAVSVLHRRLVESFDGTAFALKTAPPPAQTDPITETMYYLPTDRDDHVWLRDRIRAASAHLTPELATTAQDHR